MCGANGSKILATTRSKTVAQTMGLLKNIITYGNEAQGGNKTLDSIGKEIAEKCSRVTPPGFH
jgi:hypothetical protein